MIVTLDATALILLLDREASGPDDPETGKKVQDAHARLGYLATRISKSKIGRLIIPAPAFGEAIVKIDPPAVAQYMAIFERLRGLRFAEFDKLAAIEFAIMQREILAERPAKQRRSEIGARSRAKFDQQIVAIAKVEQSDFIVSDDAGLARYAKRIGLNCVGVGKLDLPPSDAQGSLPLEPPAMAAELEWESDI